jgi:hypothetical protein
VTLRLHDLASMHTIALNPCAVVGRNGSALRQSFANKVNHVDHH